MNILGINSGWDKPVSASKRRQLSDGGAALLVDGRIACATIEERHTRTRYEGGFRSSAAVCLADARVDWSSLDGIALSSCCDVLWTNPADIKDEIRATYGDAARLPKSAVISSVGHHQSHAMLAFFGAGVERALVAVIDGMGNRRGPASGPWWHASFERQTYYLAEWRDDGRIRLEVVAEEANGADEIGIGELYRMLTHCAGWPSYQYAGKTMALAAYGDANRWPSLRVVESNGGAMRTLIPNRHDDPRGQFETLLRTNGIDPAGIDTHIDVEKPSGAFCDFIAVVQQQVQISITNRFSALADQYGVQTVCFGGGVAMNCLSTGTFAKTRPDLRMYVPSAPSDTGQGLGNALWLQYSDQSPLSSKAKLQRPTGVVPSFLGPQMQEREIDKAVARLAADGAYRVSARLPRPALASAVANALLSGRIVGIRRGRAEYGPRALGHASVLAHPGLSDTFARVNGFKKREPFRPYAPSFLASQAAQWMDFVTPSPYMSFSAFVKEERRAAVPAILHADASARYQTVAEDGSMYSQIIEQFHRATGLPVVLNTSFNRAGEPIVETAANAAEAFVDSAMDALALGDTFIEKIAKGKS